MASLEVDATFKIDDDGDAETPVRTLRASDFAQLAAGAATSAKQDTANTTLASILAELAGTLSVESRYTPKGVRQLTLPADGSAVALSAAKNAAGATVGIPSGARFLDIQADGNTRYTDDGQTPTTSFGNRVVVPVGGAGGAWYDGNDLTALRFASETGALVVLELGFYA